jgi:hypothetical protein
MDYRHQVADFAERTLINLRWIEAIESQERQAGARNSEVMAFPLTQLIGSMLGLVVFPKERYEDHLPEISLAELENRGWPNLKVEYPSPHDCKNRRHPVCEDLRELTRVLRNGISHCNLEFTVSGDGWDIAALRLSNICPRCKQETTAVAMSVQEARILAEKYAEIIVETAVRNDGYQRRSMPRSVVGG